MRTQLVKPGDGVQLTSAEKLGGVSVRNEKRRRQVDRKEIFDLCPISSII